jgi:hypothetical protein
MPDDVVNLSVVSVPILGATPQNGPESNGVVWPEEPEHFKERTARLKQYKLLSVSDLGKLPAVEPLVEGLLFRDTLAQLSGAPGSYKSFIAVGLACALASGRSDWAGHHLPRREKVVYVAAEGATGMRARILARCERNNFEPAGLDGWLYIMPSPVQLGFVVEVDQAVAMVRDVGAGLLVLDTRARCTLGLEENSATEQGRAVQAADRIRAAAGCTVWGIHHSGRSGSTPRGSTAWDGAVWTDLRLTSEVGTAHISIEKHKDAPSDATYDYRLEPHTVAETLMPATAEDARKTLVAVHSSRRSADATSTANGHRLAEVCRNSCGTEGLSRAQLVALAIEDGVGKSRAYELINVLVNNGSLLNVGSDKRRRYVCSGAY